MKRYHIQYIGSRTYHFDVSAINSTEAKLKVERMVVQQYPDEAAWIYAGWAHLYVVKLEEINR